MPGYLTELLGIDADAEETPRHRIAADEDEDADEDLRALEIL